MRRYGLDYRRLRWSPARRRFTFYPWFARPRLGDICRQLEREFGFDVCRFGFEFTGGAAPPGPGFVPPLLEPFKPGPGPPSAPMTLLPGGIGCPAVLSQMGWVGADGLTLSQLTQAGVVLPPLGRVSFHALTGTILQIRHPSPGSYHTRFCGFAGSAQEAAEVADTWNGFSQTDLADAGYG